MTAAVVRSKDIAITRQDIVPIFTPLAAETAAILAAMTVQPSSAARSLLNRAVIGFKTNNLLVKAQSLKFFRAANLQAAFVDWKTPSRAAPTITGGVTHDPRIGLVPDGSTGYVGLGFSALSLGLAQDNIAVASKFGAGGGPVFGTVSSGSPLLHGIVSTAASLGSRVNQGGAQDNLTIPANSGHVVLSRSAGTGYSRYHEGLALADANAATSVSTGVAANEMVLFRQGSAYGAHPISFHGVFTALTAADVSALYQIVTAFDEGMAPL